MDSPSLLAASLAASIAWLAIGLLGLIPARESALARRVLFPLGALAGLALAAFGAQAAWLPSAGLGLPLGERRPPRADLPAVPRVPREHGLRHPRRRRVPVHGGLGDDGAVVLLPGHHRSPAAGDPPRPRPGPPDRAHPPARHPARLRRDARGRGRVHM